ncbi:MAG: hypothetical protein ACLT98_10935 [Eggerthellaceae bacterium]
MVVFRFIRFLVIEKDCGGLSTTLAACLKGIKDRFLGIAIMMTGIDLLVLGSVLCAEAWAMPLLVSALFVSLLLSGCCVCFIMVAVWCDERCHCLYFPILKSKPLKEESYGCGGDSYCHACHAYLFRVCGMDGNDRLTKSDRPIPKIAGIPSVAEYRPTAWLF